MIRTFLDLSTSHIPPHEAALLTTLITDLGVWDQAYQSKDGFFLWVGLAEDKLCPPALKALLSNVGFIFPGIEHVCLSPNANVFQPFQTYSWEQDAPVQEAASEDDALESNLKAILDELGITN